MFEEVLQIIEQVQQLDEEDRGTVMNMLVIQLIGRIVYYLVAGVVVLILGTRMIQAALVAWKETHRAGASEQSHETEHY